MSNDNDESFSPILPTKYAHNSAKLIYSIEKNLFVVIGVIVGLAVFSVLDVLEIRGIIDVFPENLDDTIIALFSISSLIALLPLIRLILKSKKIFEKWADTFEQNSMKAGINLSMAGKNKEEAVRAISETVEEIGESLRKYLTSKENFGEFFDVKIGNLTFDVLIDAEQVQSEANYLKKVLAEYGPIIIKITDGTVDKGVVESFRNSIYDYASLTKKDVGLAIIIGEDIESEANDLAKRSTNKQIRNLLLIEKPTHQMIS